MSEEEKTLDEMWEEKKAADEKQLDDWPFEYSHIPPRHEVWKHGQKHPREQRMAFGVLTQMAGIVSHLTDEIVIAALQSTTDNTVLELVELLIPAAIHCRKVMGLEVGTIVTESTNKEAVPLDPIEEARQRK